MIQTGEHDTIYYIPLINLMIFSVATLSHHMYNVISYAVDMDLNFYTQSDLSAPLLALNMLTVVRARFET